MARASAALAAAALLAVELSFFVRIVSYRFVDPRESAFMAARLKELRSRKPDAHIDYRWVSYDRISPQLKRAVIAAEDPTFFDHHGFDWKGIRHAVRRNRHHGRIVAGGSTITQQLAKNLFLPYPRSYLRKAQEAALTVMLEAVLTKERILELYLNVVEWGDGVFGAEAAARCRFSVSASQILPRQAAQLAAILPNPRHYARNPPKRFRTASILSRMSAVKLPDDR